MASIVSSMATIVTFSSATPMATSWRAIIPVGLRIISAGESYRLTRRSTRRNFKRRIEGPSGSVFRW
uniref:Putative secreted protein n=1 Tax=Anopheles darlingi TaxID=43151 RepID=A0A2M4D8I6_ANODA